jgi:hypothetical protein
MSRAGDQPRFGESPARRGAGSGFGRANSLIGGGVLVAVLAIVIWSAVTGQATTAQHPRLFGGSLVLDDRRPLVVLDLTTGAVTVRLDDVFAQVDATRYADVQAVPFDSGTLLVNRSSGSFNVLSKDNFVLERSGGGVGLGPLAGTVGASGVAAGSSAYIVRYAPKSTVSLVGTDTVQAAARLEQSGPRTVLPRGFASLSGAVADRPGATAVSGADLWAIVDHAGHDDVVRLHPQASNRNGIDVSDQGEVGAATAPAALESGASGMALASPGRVRLYRSGTHSEHRDVMTSGTGGATAILPVGAAQGTWWFVTRDQTGWSVFGVDGAGRVSGPHPLPGVGPGAQLVAPVLSAGRLYTLDRAAGSQPLLWQIDPSTGTVHTVVGAPSYPAANAAERADFGDAEVIARGPRLIFNNPDSLLGVVVFTDGSQPPVVIDKSAAVNVSTIGPNEGVRQAPGRAATPSTVPPSGPQLALPPPVRPAVPQVSQQVTCANTTQTPRSPQITRVVPSAHSVLVAWSYPLLDDQDCEPDSWAVRVQAVNGPQPAQPVQMLGGQLQYQFSGLRPMANYQVTVTAFIKQQSTPSAPAPFATPATGPDAPSAVHTVSDGNGHWIVSWSPCRRADCFVAADTWTVTGASCGGFVGQPPVAQVPGDQTSVTIDAAAVQLLGASMTFHVQGSTDSGLTGDPFGDHACTEAWRPPDPAHIKLQASAVAAGQTVTAQLSVSADEEAASAFGSNATDFTYHVGAQTVGPTGAMSVTIGGLTPGQQFQPTVVVNPRGHPQAAVTVNGPTISQNRQWPSDLALAATASVGPSSPNSGALNASFTDLPTVALTAAGRITCGSFTENVSGPLQAGVLSVPLDLVQIGGSCELQVQLSEVQSAMFGVPSPELSAAFTVPGSQPSQSTFTASFDNADAGDPQVVVNGQSDGKGTGWSVSVRSPSACASAVAPITSSGPLPFPQIFHLGSCDPGAPVIVEISWIYLGTQVDFTITSAGSPPAPPTTSPPVTSTTTTMPATTVPTTTVPTTTTPTTTTPPATTVPTTTTPPAAAPATTTTAPSTTG